jgi:hypothetical protein
VFAVGKPLDITGVLREEGVTNFEHPPRDRLRCAAERIRGQVQRELDAFVASHGRTRYGFLSLARALRAARPRALRATPLGWPVAFIRHERDRKRPAARNRLHALLRDWDLIGFYLPFGWPLLSLARAVRKPPCGYRGVPREARRVAEGQFLWRLAERPLPARS